MKKANSGLPLAIALIVLAALARAIPHPDNFTPVLAAALLGGAMLRPPLAYAVPIGAMLLSDLAMDHAFSWMTLVIYGCMAAGTGLGSLLKGRRTWARIAFTAVGGSVLFYVVTNFAVWAGPGSHYEHTADGLVRCYVLALPFFRNQLAGDLFWTAFLFGLFDIAKPFFIAPPPLPGRNVQ